MNLANNMKLSSLSVFFPVYNEEKNIPILLEKALQVIPQVTDRYELIIVNDGSTDQSAEVAESLAEANQRIRVINHKKNRGYGAALKTGINECRYEWLFFTDADLQFDIEEIMRFLPFTRSYEVILGYRKKRQDGPIRTLNERLWKLYIDLLFRVGVQDIDCAFKLMKTDLVQSLDLFSEGAFISSEMLYQLKKKGIDFKELPVNHLPRKYGKSTGSNFKVIAHAVLEALSVYLQIKFRNK